MRIEHPARPGGSHRFDHIAAEQADDILGRYAPGPQDLGWIDSAVHDRALEADRRGAAVEDRVAGRVEQGADVVEDVGGGGGAHASEPVRGWRRDAAAEAIEELERHRVRRHAERDRRPPAGDDVEHPLAAFEDHGERPRPAGGREGARGRRDRACPSGQVVGARQMHDQGVAGGATLDLEDAGDRRRALGVGTQAVDGLGGHRDETAGPQPVRGRGDIGDYELEAGTFLAPTNRARRHQAGTASRNSSAASMNANDSGVAKWSVLRNCT